MDYHIHTHVITHLATDDYIHKAACTQFNIYVNIRITLDRMTE